MGGSLGNWLLYQLRFLRLVDRLESDMARLQVTVADLKVGYYALVSGLKTTVSKL